MVQDSAVATLKARLRTLAGPGGASALGALVGEKDFNARQYLREGGSAPPHDFLVKVAAARRVSMDWLYGLDATPPPPDPDMPGWAHRLESRLEFIEHRLEQQEAAPPEWAGRLANDAVDQAVTLLAAKDSPLVAELAGALRQLGWPLDGAAHEESEATQDEPSTDQRQST